jgi:hypothetical protein
MNKTIQVSHFLAAFFFVFASHAFASSAKTCASIANMEKKPSQNALTILVDQTTVVDQNLIDKFKAFAINGLAPSTEIKVYTFSAFSQGEYFTKHFSGLIDAELSKEQRYNTPKRQLTIFDRCIQQQGPAMAFQTQKAIDVAMKGARSDLAKSDIVYSLGKLSESIRSSQATNKYVVIFSDMLENSATTSFYNRGSVRKININKELNKVINSGFKADFSGAEVYVMGAGLVSEKGRKRGVYRSPEILQALEGFWRQWFKNSNAKLMGFGMPELQTTIR